MKTIKIIIKIMIKFSVLRARPITKSIKISRNEQKQKNKEQI